MFEYYEIKNSAKVVLDIDDDYINGVIQNVRFGLFEILWEDGITSHYRTSDCPIPNIWVK